MNSAVKDAVASSAAVVLLTLSAMPLVLAAQLAPEEKAFRGKAEIADATLGDMRGRYISADQILYFGVEMHTVWHTAAGDVYGAALNIGIDRSTNTARPTTVVTGSVQAVNGGNGNGSSNASSAQISNGGLNQVRGVSQVVQTAGNGNGVANNIGIDVTTQRPAVAGTSASNGGNRALVDLQNGATAQTYVSSTGAGVRVFVPTQGSASQSIASGIGMQQRAQVSGDSNAIYNQLNMVIQVQNNSAAAVLQMNNLSQTMHGLWQAGIH